MIAILTYLLLFFVPLIVFPGINLRFEPPKVLAAELLIQLLTLTAILTGTFNLKKGNRALGIILLSLFFLSLLHLILSPTEQNLFGNIFRLQGTILFWHFLVLTFIAQNIYFRLKSKYIYLVSFLAVCISAFIFGNNSAGRLIGSLGEPNALGAVVVLIFPFVFLSFKSIWIRVMGVIGAIAVINFTQSKSALLALSLELLFLVLVKIFKGRHVLAAQACLILLVLSLTWPFLEREYFLKTNINPLNFRFEDRAQIWQVSFEAGLQAPIIGSGLESIQGQIHQAAQKLNVNTQYQIVDSAHNIFLDSWIWGGILGLGLLGMLGVLGVKNMIHKKMILELAVFLGLLTVLSFNPGTVSVLAGFWWIIGRSFSKEA